jgi:mannose-1-phosphate guanylyltransferase
VGSIVWNNVNLGRGSMIVNSIIMSNCMVDRYTEEYNAILTGSSRHLMAV